MKYSATTTGLMSLDELIAHLSTHERVAGILQIGSLAGGTITDASDYDLVIVQRGEQGAEAQPPWYVGMTQVDHRATDLVFVAASEVERLSTLTTPIGPGDGLAPIIRWIQRGHVVFDRTGLVDRARCHLGSKSWIEPVDDQVVHGVWFAINYNLVQTRRMLLADDALYQTTAIIRMAVYGHPDLWHGYFTLRKLPWEGDKAAVAYLSQHDPQFLEAYKQFIAEPAPAAKLLAYERAAAGVTSAWGGLWPADTTAMNVDYALETWQALLQAR